MRNLQEFVNRLNFWRMFYQYPKIELPWLTEDDVEEIISRLEDKLTPENLNPNNELCYEQVMVTRNFFKRVYDELKECVGDVRELEVRHD